MGIKNTIPTLDDRKILLPMFFGILFTVFTLGFANSAEAFNVVDVTVDNFSNPDQVIDNGNYIVREYASENISTTPVVLSGNQASFTNHFAWFQDMRVDQPNAPNFALIYRHNIGYEMEFTVEDPLNEGYTIDVDHSMRGYLTVSREEPKNVSVTSGLLLGRIDDGSGPIHYSGFFISGGGLSVPASAVDPFASSLITKSKSFTSPVTYFGTKTFVISFSSFPSPALVNTFANFGGGEGAIQFGVPSTHVSGGDPSRPDFQYDDYTGPSSEGLADLGHFATVTVTSLGVGNTAPEITLLGLDPTDVECNVEYVDAGATASDNEDGDLTSSIVTGGLVPAPDTSIPGISFEVTYDVSDAAGTAADQQSRTVDVVDTTDPIITAELVPFGSGEQCRFIVEISSSDSCDASPATMAELNGIPVSDGTVVELETDDDTKIDTKSFSDKKCAKFEEKAEKKLDKGKPVPEELQWKLLICEAGGLLELEAPNFGLFAKTVDESDNMSTITVEPDLTTCEGEDTTVSGSESDNSESSSSDSGNSGSGSGSDNINSDSESE